VTVSLIDHSGSASDADPSVAQESEQDHAAAGAGHGQDAAGRHPRGRGTRTATVGAPDPAGRAHSRQRRPAFGCRAHACSRPRERPARRSSARTEHTGPEGTSATPSRSSARPTAPGPRRGCRREPRSPKPLTNNSLHGPPERCGVQTIHRGDHHTTAGDERIAPASLGGHLSKGQSQGRFGRQRPPRRQHCPGSRTCRPRSRSLTWRDQRRPKTSSAASTASGKTRPSVAKWAKASTMQ